MFYLFLWWLYLFFDGVCLFFDGVCLYGLNEMCSLHADNYGNFLILAAMGIVGSIVIALVLYFSDKE